MSHLIINSITFSGTADGAGNQDAWQPNAYERTYDNIGVTLVAANGTRNRVRRGAIKRVWTIGWARTNLATLNTLRTIQALNTTFPFTDVHGTSYTVQTEDALEEAFNFVDQSGAQFWDVTLKLFQV